MTEISKKDLDAALKQVEAAVAEQKANPDQDTSWVDDLPDYEPIEDPDDTSVTFIKKTSGN